jgi:hypothetical protein
MMGGAFSTTSWVTYSVIRLSKITSRRLGSAVGCRLGQRRPDNATARRHGQALFSSRRDVLGRFGPKWGLFGGGNSRGKASKINGLPEVSCGRYAL